MSKHDHLAVLRELEQAKADVKQPVIQATQKRSQPMEEEQFDLDRELDNIEQEFVEIVDEPPAQIIPMEEQLELAVLDMLHKHPDAPSSEQIKAWKGKYGENGVQVVAFDPENVFVLTHLTVSQWDKINKIKDQLQAKDAPSAEKRMREAIIKSAVLWPKLDSEFFANCRAGLPNSLVDLIMVNSYFLSPQQTLTLTAKL